MSRYIDINQLLEQIGTSGRSASDPWTLSRRSGGTVQGSAFSPAVDADMSAPAQDLTSEIQSSERITQADILASSPSGGATGGSSSSGGGFLGGLLNFFPLASGIAKIFGFGDNSSPAALTPYELPPSINFQGAMAGPTAGVTSLSYGANGLPRTAARAQTPAVAPAPAPVTNNQTDMLGELGSLAQPPTNTSASHPTDSSVFDQLGTLTGNTFSAEPAVANDLPSISQNSPGNDLSSATESTAGTNPASSGTSSTSTQQGHSILVQVQAMDSQSFMDHSQDIAQAVRQAMLNMNSLNDVILDL